MIKVIDFKEHKRNTMQGFITIQFVDLGLEVKGFTLHDKNGERWLGMPSQSYQKDGKLCYSKTVYFYDHNRVTGFQEEALEALDEFFKSTEME